MALWCLGVIGILAGAVWFMMPKAKAPQPAPKPRNVSGPPPAPAAPPLPDYIPRWNRARILREWKDLAEFQLLLNEKPAPRDPFKDLRDKMGSL